jgi:hypothetical protein
MENMGSSRPSNRSIYDSIRKQWVVAHPEEIVRQAVLHYMVHQLEFPAELMAIEKSLKELSCSATHPPDRRADIVVFRKSHSLFPLLLIECKAGLCSESAFEQLLGYNHYVRAPFVALIGKDEMKVADCQKGFPELLSTLPSYPQLYELDLHLRSW